MANGPCTVCVGTSTSADHLLSALNNSAKGRALMIRKRGREGERVREVGGEIECTNTMSLVLSFRSMIVDCSV